MVAKGLSEDFQQLVLYDHDVYYTFDFPPKKCNNIENVDIVPYTLVAFSGMKIHVTMFNTAQASKQKNVPYYTQLKMPQSALTSRVKLNYSLLKSDSYVNFPNFEPFCYNFDKLLSQLQTNQNFTLTIKEMQKQISGATKVDLQYEKDRAAIWADEIEKKLVYENNYKVVLEFYGRSVEKWQAGNPFSPCGQSPIDIVILNNTPQQGNDLFLAGAVIEMKTKFKNVEEHKAQTAYEMLKFATDMMIEKKLLNNEQPKEVTVYGLLVDMSQSEAYVMKLVLEFNDDTSGPYQQKSTFNLTITDKAESVVIATEYVLSMLGL